MLRGQRGDTVVTVLLAAGLVALAAVGGAAIVRFMRTESEFSRTTGTALAVESYLLAALQKAESYSPAALDQLRAGQSPDGLRFELERNGVKSAVAQVGSRLDLNADGAACSAAPCALHTELRFQCTGAVCRAAYRVDIDQAVTKVSLPPLGAAQWPPRPEDFTQLVNFEIYRRADTGADCAPGDLFVGGMNRTSGAVLCVHPTTRRLAPNEIAKGVTYGAGTQSLELKALALKAGKCPAKYAAQRVRPSSLESSPEGTCVYRYKKEVPWMKPWPTGSESVSGRFCPASDYEAVGDGTCTVSVVSKTPGNCPKTCTDASGHAYDCSYTVEPDTSHSVSQSVSGPNVTCSLVKTGTQQCGASWVGAVQWQGRCKLTLPETTAMGAE